jgi:hypothetical protein
MVEVVGARRLNDDAMQSIKMRRKEVPYANVVCMSWETVEAQTSIVPDCRSAQALGWWIG